MSPNKVGLSKRVEEFKNETMIVFDAKKQIMMCNSCNVRVEWEKKSTVQNHVKSSHHAQNKIKFLSKQAEEKKRQISISDAVDNAKRLKTDRDEFIMSTVRAFMAANIPLRKLGNKKIRKWANTYIKGAGDLPSVDWIRKHIVPKVKAEEEDRLANLVADENLAVLCDETTDKRGRAIFITLFKIFPKDSALPPKIIVASVQQLQQCNAQTCSENIIMTLNKYKVQYKNVKCIASDSAAYMTLCAKTLKGIIGDHLIHVQCWSHKLDKLEKIPSQHLTNLNAYVQNTKHVFLNTRKRKHRYISFLENKYGVGKEATKKAKLFPIPVMTRWNSWVKSVEYISEYTEDIFEFVRTLDDTESNAVEYFKKLEELDWKTVKAEACFVVEHCAPVSELLLLLEGSKYPLAHRLLPKFKELLAGFTIIMESERIKDVTGVKTRAALCNLPRQDMCRAGRRMRCVAQKSFDRLTALINSDTAKIFWESTAELFCPVKIISSSVDSVTAAYQNIPMLHDIPLAQFLVQHAILKREIESYSERTNSKNIDVVHEVLKGMAASENRKFAVVCLQVIFLPVSNVDSERAFSGYGDIFSPKRTNLSVENTEVSMYLYFNDCDDSESETKNDEELNNVSDDEF